MRKKLNLKKNKCKPWDLKIFCFSKNISKHEYAWRIWSVYKMCGCVCFMEKIMLFFSTKSKEKIYICKVSPSINSTSKDFNCCCFVGERMSFFVGFEIRSYLGVRKNDQIWCPKIYIRSLEYSRKKSSLESSVLYVGKLWNPIRDQRKTAWFLKSENWYNGQRSWSRCLSRFWKTGSYVCS